MRATEPTTTTIVRRRRRRRIGRRNVPSQPKTYVRLNVVRRVRRIYAALNETTVYEPRRPIPTRRREMVPRRVPTRIRMGVPPTRQVRVPTTYMHPRLPIVPPRAATRVPRARAIVALPQVPTMTMTRRMISLTWQVPTSIRTLSINDVTSVNDNVHVPPVNGHRAVLVRRSHRLIRILT